MFLNNVFISLAETGLTARQAIRYLQRRGYVLSNKFSASDIDFLCKHAIGLYGNKGYANFNASIGYETDSSILRYLYEANHYQRIYPKPEEC